MVQKIKKSKPAFRPRNFESVSQNCCGCIALKAVLGLQCLPWTHDLLPTTLSTCAIEVWGPGKHWLGFIGMQFNSKHCVTCSLLQVCGLESRCSHCVYIRMSNLGITKYGASPKVGLKLRRLKWLLCSFCAISSYASSLREPQPLLLYTRYFLSIEMLSIVLLTTVVGKLAR